ncbi:hypothetical protein V1477_018869 [Vespula maculifrons]|uniref:Uncharacterized protein n=1 Tax=Vespula maculifrons TaxID=7453 RepID=A0ABD2ATG8_VESMC
MDVVSGIGLLEFGYAWPMSLRRLGVTNSRPLCSRTKFNIIFSFASKNTQSSKRLLFTNDR